MPKKTVSDFEDSIDEVEREYKDCIPKLTALLKKKPRSNEKILAKIGELHSKAVDYFNLFERSIVEYSLKVIEINYDVRIDKAKSAINIANVIIQHWGKLKFISDKLNIKTPKPPDEAYDMIQRLIKAYNPQKAKELKIVFEKLGLPINGFNSKKIPFIMTKKQQISYGAIVGTVLIVVLLIIAFINDCPTAFQSRIFLIVLALAGAAFSAVILGTLNITNTKVTATSGFAVLLLLIFSEPVKITDLKSCQTNITGTVYFGGKPIQIPTTLKLIKQNQLTNTNNFGNFNLQVDISSINDQLEIQVLGDQLQIDTTMSFPKSELSKPLDIRIDEICVICTQKDSTGLVIKEYPEVCSASNKFINKSILDMKKSGSENDLKVECKKE